MDKKLTAFCRVLSLGWLLMLMNACANYNQAPVSDLGETAADKVGSSTQTTKKVVLLLPLQGDFAKAGQAVRDGFLQKYSQNDLQKTTGVKVLDSRAYPSIHEAYAAALDQKPDLIVGPLTKDDVQGLVSQGPLTVPTLLLNQVGTGNLSPDNKVYQFSLDPQADAAMLARKMNQLGFTQVYIVAPKDNWGQGIAASFGRQWLALQGKIVNSLAYDSQTDLSAGLQELFVNVDNSDLTNKQAIFLVASADKARLLAPMLKTQAAKLPIYTLPLVYNGLPQVNLNQPLNAIFFPSTNWLLNSSGAARQEFANVYPDASGDDVRLYGFGADAARLAKYYLNHANSFTGLALKGYSGDLSMDGDGIIKRQLLMATFQQGLAIPASQATVATLPIATTNQTPPMLTPAVAVPASPPVNNDAASQFTPITNEPASIEELNK